MKRGYGGYEVSIDFQLWNDGDKMLPRLEGQQMYVTGLPSEAGEATITVTLPLEEAKQFVDAPSHRYRLTLEALN